MRQSSLPAGTLTRPHPRVQISHSAPTSAHPDCCVKLWLFLYFERHSIKTDNTDIKVHKKAIDIHCREWWWFVWTRRRVNVSECECVGVNERTNARTRKAKRTNERRSWAVSLSRRSVSVRSFVCSFVRSFVCSLSLVLFVVLVLVRCSDRSVLWCFGVRCVWGWTRMLRAFISSRADDGRVLLPVVDRR